MRTLPVFVAGTGLLLAVAYGQGTDQQATDNAPHFDDYMTMRAILNECGLPKVRVEDVTVSENGRIVSLDLSNKDLSQDGIKAIPPAVGDLTELRTLIAKGNCIAGFPAALAKLRGLQKLDLGGNKISILPPVIGELENLEMLDLRYNAIDTLPPDLARLKKLSYLQLWGNKLVEIPSALVLMPELRELYLKDNRLTSLPEGIVRMKSLKYIDIEGNKLCNEPPKIDAWLKETTDKRYRQLQKCW